MARDKTSKKLKALRDASPDGRPTMKPDAFHPDETHKLEDGAAVIHSVTPDMMDHAAHEAARLADAAAHGEGARPAADGAAQAARDGAETVTVAVEDATERAGTTVGDTVEAVSAAATEASDAAVDTTQEVAAAARDIAADAVSAVDRTAEAAAARVTGATDTLGDYGAKVLEMVRANAAATGAFFAALVQAKSVPEAMALNADHMRRQFDTLTSQGRELAVLAQRLAFDALKPLDGVIRRDR